MWLGYCLISRLVELQKGELFCPGLYLDRVICSKILKNEMKCAEQEFK